jgi:hypothetical protein
MGDRVVEEGCQKWDWIVRSIGLSCKFCIFRVELRERINMADFESLIAAIGGLEAVINNNQAKMENSLKEIIAEMRAWRKETRPLWRVRSQPQCSP